jgi:heme-degrading monooxygenase HmoA
VIVMFTARRLKPGAWEQFRRAWDPDDAKPPGFQRAYHARNIRDEDEVISFGCRSIGGSYTGAGMTPRA